MAHLPLFVYFVFGNEQGIIVPSPCQFFEALDMLEVTTFILYFVN